MVRTNGMLAAVLLSIVLSVHGRSLLSNMPPPGQLYITISSSDRTTQQGQQPKIVAQFGNIGGIEVTDPSFDCYYYNDQPAQAVVYVKRELYFQKLIPGQNQNAEHQYVAANLGSTHRYCIIYGTTLVNGVPTSISAKSNTIDVTVVPQQG